MSMPESPAEGIHGLVDHLFRREAGRMMAALTHALGPAHLDLAEEAVQEALVKALQHWPFHGVPDDPAAWLIRVARNRALDILRRGTTRRDKAGDVRRLLEASPPTQPGDREAVARLDGGPTDDQLRLIFLCCHPDLPRDAQVALTLKTVCGFGVEEIAAAFLTKPATIAQRLVRAKRRLKSLDARFEFPSRRQLPHRLDGVMEVLYLLFNEGYAAHRGEALLRADLCDEALRLTVALAHLPATDRPVVHGLAALMLFQASRAEARMDAVGELVLLDDQDRDRWDRRLIARAFAHMERSAQGDQITPYHLQAAIAAEHAMAPSDAATDWPEILGLYDRLYRLQPSPIIALNRAVALARVEGPTAGLEAVDALASTRVLADYAHLHATRARFLADLGQRRQAAEACRKAARLTDSAPQRRFLKRLEATLRVPRTVPQSKSRPRPLTRGDSPCSFCEESERQEIIV
jgi:RNA polymerase sigma-70 factor (ECF subfamily)